MQNPINGLGQVYLIINIVYYLYYSFIGFVWPCKHTCCYMAASYPEETAEVAK